MNLDHVLDIDQGRLVSDRDAMAKAFENACKSNKPIVIHFHGGLVSRDSALAERQPSRLSTKALALIR